ncbi:MAG: ABC transporter substrate-binding protein [Acidimicrobiales bacterium]
MINKRELHRLLALLFAFTLVAAACGGSDDGDDGGTEESSEETSEESEETTRTTIENTEIAEVEDEIALGGRLVVGIDGEPGGLRPWEDTSTNAFMNLGGTVYDKLFEYDENFEPQPYLVESYTVSDDNMTYVLTLREGVTFHNGEPFNAQTLVDMFEIQKAGTSSAGPAAAITSIEATGEYEATYNLARPSGVLPASLTRPQLGMVFEPAAAAADPEGFADAPVGTGPFMVTERDIDNRTVLAKNPDYWRTDADGNQLPYLDEIEFRPMPEENQRLDALLASDIDMFVTLRGATIRDSRNEADLVLYEFQGNLTGGGIFNMSLAPTDDVRVRRGLSLLNPQDQVIEALGATGLSEPATQFFSPDSPFYSQAVADGYPSFDFEAGVASLQDYVDDPARSDGKAAGEPIDIVLACPADPTLTAAMQVMEGVWTQTGLLTVELLQTESAAHVPMAMGAAPDFVGEHQAHCWRFSSDEDPSTPLFGLVAPPNTASAEEAATIVPSATPSATNFTDWWSLEAYTAYIQASQIADVAARQALYESVFLAANEDVPLWYSGHTPLAFVTTDAVKGINGWHLPDGSLGSGIQGVEGRFFEVFVTE